jgi:hypothetical protein
MDSFYAAIIVLGFFLLRLGVPLLITAAVCYGLRRLDAHWQAEAEVEKITRPEVAIVNIGTGRR